MATKEIKTKPQSPTAIKSSTSQNNKSQIILDENTDKESSNNNATSKNTIAKAKAMETDSSLCANADSKTPTHPIETTISQTINPHNKTLHETDKKSSDDHVNTQKTDSIIDKPNAISTSQNNISKLSPKDTTNKDSPTINPNRKETDSQSFGIPPVTKSKAMETDSLLPVYDYSQTPTFVETEVLQNSNSKICLLNKTEKNHSSDKIANTQKGDSVIDKLNALETSPLSENVIEQNGDDANAKEKNFPIDKNAGLTSIETKNSQNINSQIMPNDTNDKGSSDDHVNSQKTESRNNNQAINPLSIFEGENNLDCVKVDVCSPKAESDDASLLTNNSYTKEEPRLVNEPSNNVSTTKGRGVGVKTLKYQTTDSDSSTESSSGGSDHDIESSDESNKSEKGIISQIKDFQFGYIFVPVTQNNTSSCIFASIHNHPCRKEHMQKF